MDRNIGYWFAYKKNEKSIISLGQKGITAEEELFDEIMKVKKELLQGE